MNKKTVICFYIQHIWIHREVIFGINLYLGLADHRIRENLEAMS